MTYTLRSFLIIILFATLLIYGKNVTAGNFFVECDEATLEKEEFLPLKKYYDEHPGEPYPDKCFRLNNNEFLITVTISDLLPGLYYFNAKEEKLERDERVWASGTTVAEEFLGKNNKRYVLLSWSNLSHGEWSHGFDILNLIPKREGKPYIVYHLLDAIEDDSGLCGVWSSKDKNGKIERHQSVTEGKRESIKGYKILDQGTENVQIVFTITEQDCKTLKERTYQKTFRLVDGVFKLAN